MYVIKIGGNEIDQPAFLDGLADMLTGAPPLVLVHGGGKEISVALERHGLSFEFVAGTRVTDTAAMGVVEQVLSGAINKRIVARLNAVGCPAIGLSGVDLALLETEPLRQEGRDMGRVGQVVEVKREVLEVLLAQGWLPVISPVAIDREDRSQTSVNADLAALAIARALDADELIFVSNVPGVLLDGVVTPEMDSAAVEAAVAAGTISGGMIPKARSAIAALATVRAVRITNLAGLRQGGTRFV